MENPDTIVEQALAQFSGITDAAQLDQAKARYLGKSGALTALLKTLGKLSPEEREAMLKKHPELKEKLGEAGK